MPTMPPPETTLIDRVIASRLIRRRSCKSIAWAHEDTTDAQPRPTAKQCMESACAHGGDPYTTLAAWGFVRCKKTGELIDLVTEPRTSNRTGIVATREAFLALACFTEFFDFQMPVDITIQRFRNDPPPMRA